MNTKDLFDEAYLRNEFRRTYKEHGYVYCIGMLYEMVFGAQILIDVICEEIRAEKKE